ncbi:MAG: polyprenyl synthetase family protein [Gemmatimonadota bacterium]
MPATTPESIPVRRARVEDALRAFLDRELEGVAPAAAGPIAYAVMSPGKRIRPLLMMAAYQSAGGEAPGIVDLACSVELVHAYSLVHDDLPCMDDDVLRRGRPTVHVRFGVAAAVMAGAALMPMAVQAIVDAAPELRLDDAAVRSMVRMLTSASGATGMVGGQLLDLRAEGRPVERDELERIHTGKTARLISASVALGGMAAGADRVDVERLERFGLRLGLAFQAIDDILDLRGDTAQLGKESGRDSVLRKATYPGLFGLAEAEAISRDLARAASEELAEMRRAEGLRELARYIIDRSH